MKYSVLPRVRASRGHGTGLARWDGDIGPHSASDGPGSAVQAAVNVAQTAHLPFSCFFPLTIGAKCTISCDSGA